MVTDRRAFSAHHSGFIEIIVNKCQFLLGVLWRAGEGGVTPHSPSHQRCGGDEVGLVYIRPDEIL